MSFASPPERLPAGQFWLRRASVAVADALAAAVASSQDHLRPWMAWATDAAADPASQLVKLAACEEAWAAGSEYRYAVVDPEGAIVGVASLHRRVGAGALEVGYWVHVAHVGGGIATAAAGVLTAAALALPDVDRVEIHVDEANVASGRVPAKLGYELSRVDVKPPEAPAESGRCQIWVRHEGSVRGVSG